jgi:Protein of unknown function (DUF3307)
MKDTLLLAIIGHLVGDYLLQNDWMALNKKVSGPYGNIACVTHCSIWSMAVIVFSGWYHAIHLFDVCTVLFITHYAQDRTDIVRIWMTKINHQPKFVEPPMAPWSLIVVDNVWHILTLWAVWRFMI